MIPYKVGDQIVSVGSWFPDPELGTPNVPLKGCVYTVRGFVQGCNEELDIGVYLEEVVNPPFQCIEGFMEMAFRADRFKPVVKTDISVFQAMLNNVPEGVENGAISSR